jgi:hypothetical protein
MNIAYKMSAKKLQALPKVTQAQLLATALHGTDADDEEVSDVVKAVKYLSENSEGDEVYVKYFTFKGQKYASVIYYGGGNAVGLIFKDGSAIPYAQNGDDSIVCVE